MDSKNLFSESKNIIDSFTSQYPNGIVIIWGATATGKTALSLELAKNFPIEII